MTDQITVERALLKRVLDCFNKQPRGLYRMKYGGGGDAAITWELSKALVALDAELAPGAEGKKGEPPHCPKCGYTYTDCLTHLDHALCGEPDPPVAAEAKEQDDG